MKPKKNNSQTNVIKLLSIILVLVLLVAGVTFAYFSVNVLGNDEMSSISFDTGDLEIDFQTTAYISNKSGELIKATEIATKADHTDFTVQLKENTKRDVDYTLSLTDITISDNLKSQDFKWELIKGSTTLNSGTFANANTGQNITLTPSKQTISPNNKDSYILRVYLLETNVDQSSLYEGTFQGKVAISAVEH